MGAINSDYASKSSKCNLYLMNDIKDSRRARFMRIDSVRFDCDKKGTGKSRQFKYFQALPKRR
jgi:hypothetical protein